jgi:hypothetical protein
MSVLRSETTLMYWKRTATIVLAGGALAAWLAGAATSNREMPAPLALRSVPIDARGVELAGEVAKLHDRLRPTAAPRQPGRNLFAFHVAPVAPAAEEPPKPALVEAPAPKAPAQPTLKLSGIAEDPGPDGPVRLAIISGDGQLFMVKEGEAVTSRYRVVKISADVVELGDLGDGTTRRLALK